VDGDGNRGRTWQLSHSLGLPTPLCGLLCPNESLASLGGIALRALLAVVRLKTL